MFCVESDVVESFVFEKVEYEIGSEEEEVAVFDFESDVEFGS